MPSKYYIPIPPTQSVLDKIDNHLNYCPESGTFTWINLPGAYSKKNGQEAGCVRPDGYRRINFVYNKSKAQKTIYVHHIAYYLMKGTWPPFPLDHKNGDPSNNSWSNLRLDVNGQNLQNMKLSKKNTSGVTGVTKYEKGYMAHIRIDAKLKNLGIYPTLEEAANVRKMAEDKYQKDFSRRASREQTQS